MSMLIAPLVILAGIAVALLCWTLLPSALTQGDRVVLRKRLLHTPARGAADPVQGKDRLATVSDFVQARLPVHPRQQLEARLVMAGCFGKRALVVLVLAKVILAVTGTAIGLGFSPLWSLAGGLAGFLAPDLWLRQRTQKRQQQIVLAMPNGMDMLAISVEAGLTLDAAIQRFSAQESPSSRALCQEMRLFLKDVQLGRSRSEAYADFGRRSGVHDLRLLASALNQADRWGVEMTNVMRIQAEHLRIRRLQRAEEMAMKAPIKILLPLVFFIFPAILVILLGPAAIQLGKLFPGH